MDNEAFLKAVKSLLSDIRSMVERPQTYPDQFGPFSDYIDDDDSGAIIQWPNLAIAADEVQKLIYEHEKVLVIGHQDAFGHDGAY